MQPPDLSEARFDKSPYAAMENILLASIFSAQEENFEKQFVF